MNKKGGRLLTRKLLLYNNLVKHKKKGGAGTPDRLQEARNTPEAAMEYIRAVIRGDYARIEELLTMGLDINSKNYNGFTALAGAAVIKKDPNMVEFLLKNNADPNLKIDNHSNIPLINYIMNTIDLDTYTRKKIIELLIKYGGEPNYDFGRDRRINRIPNPGNPMQWNQLRPLDNDEERYLRERMYKDRQKRTRKLNTAKLLNSRLAETSEQPDDMNLVERIMGNYDEIEDKKRDEELRNELIGEYVNELNQYGGKKKKKKTVKKKKIIKKIYKGGYPDPNFIAIDQNDYLRIHSMTNYNTEVCGNFFIDDWNEAQIDEHIGTSRGGRSVCRHNRYSQFIWHTHPQHGKYYPSAEDIIKIMKNNHKIQRSWIFTTYGYWTMEYTGDHIHLNNDGGSYLYDMLLNEYPRVENGSGIIDEINDWFYEETNRGREYNNYMIWEYINALESNIPGLEIWWYDF